MKKILVALVMCLLMPTMAFAEIQLTLEPTKLTYEIGEVADVKFIAKNTANESLSISSIAIALQWDPNKLELLGVKKVYNWYAQGFYPGTWSGRLNERHTEGLGALILLTGSSAIPYITLDGFHAATIQFKVLEVGSNVIDTIKGTNEYRPDREITVIHGNQIGLVYDEFAYGQAVVNALAEMPKDETEELKGVIRLLVEYLESIEIADERIDEVLDVAESYLE